MRVAVEGCGHGTLHSIYASIAKSCEINNWHGVDLLIIGGDFQAVRNANDLNCMSVPQKFRAIGDFHEYYSGARVAPYLTIFVGGNHEASSHLQELYYGGWVAPKIYYLGAANVIRVGDLRIAGLSGIWKGYNFNKPHFERVPYTADEVKSVYHVREIDVRKLLLLRTQVDVGISHDWPRGVEWLGDYKALFRKKDLFEADARAGTLGSSAARYVMDRLRPPHWFSAHLHCKYAAVVDYAKTGPSPEAQSNQDVEQTKNTDEIDLEVDDDGGRAQAPPSEPTAPVKNTDEIDLDFDDDVHGKAAPSEPGAPTKNANEIDLDVDDDANDDKHPTPTPHTSQPLPQATTSTEPIAPSIRSLLPASFAPRPTPTATNTQPPSPPEIQNTRTHFLALDKCLPHRPFLQLLTLTPLSSSSSSPPPRPTLTYDPEYLSILRLFGPHDPRSPSPPNLGEPAYLPLLAKERAWIEEHVVKAGKSQVPEDWEITAPVYDGMGPGGGGEQPREWANGQTARFCELIGVRNWWDGGEEEREEWRVGKGRVVEEERRDGGGGRGRGGGGRGRGGRGRGRGRGR